MAATVSQDVTHFGATASNYRGFLFSRWRFLLSVFKSYCVPGTLLFVVRISFSPYPFYLEVCTSKVPAFKIRFLLGQAPPSGFSQPPAPDVAPICLFMLIPLLTRLTTFPPTDSNLDFRHCDGLAGHILLCLSSGPNSVLWVFPGLPLSCFLHVALLSICSPPCSSHLWDRRLSTRHKVQTLHGHCHYRFGHQPSLSHAPTTQNPLDDLLDMAGPPNHHYQKERGPQRSRLPLSSIADLWVVSLPGRLVPSSSCSASACASRCKNQNRSTVSQYYHFYRYQTHNLFKLPVRPPRDS